MDKLILEDGEIRTTFDNEAYHLETTRDNQGNITTNFDVKTQDTQAMLQQLMQDVVFANGQVDMILFNLRTWANENLIAKEAYDEIVRVVNSSVNTATFHQR